MNISLKHHIAELDLRKKNKQEEINELTEKIEKFKSFKEITNQELLLAISQIDQIKDFSSENFDIKTTTRNYEFILGGDGRSQPWSETRHGTLCEVTLKVFLTHKQKDILEKNLAELFIFDQLKIIQ